MQEKNKSAGYDTAIPLLGNLYIREYLRLSSLVRYTP